MEGSVDHLLVYGYIRRIEKAVKGLRIPTDLYQSCYDFGRECDEFAECGFMIEINDENNLIENIGVKGGGNSYGLLGIKQTPYTSAFIYQWRFKIINKRTYDGLAGLIAIGFAESHYDSKGTRYYGKDNTMWHWSISDIGYIHKTVPEKDGKSIILECINTRDMDTYNNGDEVIVKLVPGMKLVEVAVSNDRGIESKISAEIRFTGDDTEYRLAVFLAGLGVRLKLMDFHKLLEKDGNYCKEVSTSFNKKLSLIIEGGTTMVRPIIDGTW